MARLVQKRSETIGLPPGTLVYIGDRPAKEIKITLATYNNQEYAESRQESLRECLLTKDPSYITWVDVSGLHQVKDLEYLGKCLNLHPLVLEDIRNSDQRPKLEDYGTYLFLVLKMLHLKEQTDEVLTEQVSVIVGENFVISLHENDEDVFDPVRLRLQTGKGRIRKAGADYLAYTLLDIIVDHYFGLLERLGEVIEELEAELVARPSSATLNQIHRLKRDTILMRRSVWPLRDVVNRLEKSESPLIKDQTIIYLRDVYDHVTMVIDSIENFRDLLTGMMDIYLSSLSNRINEVMKVLTIIATIFIPLTFIVGVYGMNFKYMPELEWHWGYFSLWLVMALLSLGMVLYFRNKGWIGRK